MPRGKHDARAMSLFEHLAELRKRLVMALAGFAAAVIVCLFMAEPLYGLAAAAILPFLKGAPLVYTNPADPVVLYLKIAFTAGLFFASPFIFLQLWLFIAPGLHSREKRFALSFSLFTALLFVAGGAFGYFVALPSSLGFFLSVGGPFRPMITITGYFDMAIAVVLGCGLVFEIPVLIFFFSFFGLVSGRSLLTRFHYAVFAISIVAAVITPTTDAVTMIVFMVPMIILYAIGVLIAFIFGEKRPAGALEDQAPSR